MIDPKSLGTAPVGLIEKSRQAVENVIVTLSNGYMLYRMVDGHSQYVGTVDYSRVVIQ